MEQEEYRVIPGYESYGVTNSGEIKCLETGLILKQYVLGGYLIADTFRGSLTETLPVHRAVALAWVNNPSPMMFTVVNHRDANPMNNWWQNLEWTNYSGNNYHAIRNGLRSDNIRCRIRNFYTEEVYEFDSMAQAAEYMGLRKDVSIHQLYPKMFGKLIADRYEFRFANDPTPWFYQNKTELVPPSRYMVTVKNPDGTEKEIYSNRALLKEYQLYDSPGKSIPVLAQYGKQVHPDKEFIVRDSYTEARYRATRQTDGSEAIRIQATYVTGTCLNAMCNFDSLTQCADYFNVDRSCILNRLNNGANLDGWTFTQLPL